MARRFESIRILIPGLTLSAALLAGLASSGCQRPDPGSAEELALINRGCNSSTRNDTYRKVQACIDGTRFGRESRNCEVAKRRCADEYSIDTASDPMDEADVFASCWTGARAYLLQQFE